MQISCRCMYNKLCASTNLHSHSSRMGCLYLGRPRFSGSVREEEGKNVMFAITHGWVEPWTSELYLPVPYRDLPFMYLPIV